MNHRIHKNVTDYYDANARTFTAETKDLDLSHAWEPFLAALPSPARILDAGCGSGRDALVFLRRGHDVTACDASARMVAEARANTDLPVHHIAFHDIPWQQAFDGVWANASLLHVPHADLPTALERLGRALVVGGTLYVSFKHGTDEGMARGGTLFFSRCDEDRMRRLVETQPTLRLDRVWTTPDTRPGRSHQRWLHALITRVEP